MSSADFSHRPTALLRPRACDLLLVSIRLALLRPRACDLLLVSIRVAVNKPSKIDAFELPVASFVALRTAS